MPSGIERPRGDAHLRVIVVMCFAGTVAAGVGVATYGCKFSRGLCRPEEVCVDDNLFGSCQDRAAGSFAASASRLDRHPVFVLDSRLRRLLEVVMGDLVRDGYSWRDAMTQCLISAVLGAYEDRLSDVQTGACDAYARSSNGGAARGSEKEATAAAARDGGFGFELTSIVDLVNAAGTSNGRRDKASHYGAGSAGAGELLRPRPVVDDDDSPALSRDDLQALELFLRLSDADPSAVKPMAPSSASAAARLPAANPREWPQHGGAAAAADGRPGQAGYDRANRPEAEPVLRKIDAELVGRLLRDEIGVDELMPEEIRQLTLFIKAILNDVASPLVESSTASPSLPVTAKQVAVSSGRTSNSIKGHDAVSAFVEESMVKDRSLDVGSTSRILPAAVEPPTSLTGGDGGASAASAKPAAPSDAELQAELEHIGSEEERPPLDGAAKRVPVSASSTLLTDEPYVDVVDSSYGWVKFVSSVDPREAKSLLSRVSHKLGMSNDSIVDLRVKDEDVVFHVLPNDRNISATEVAKAIAEHRDELVTASGGLPEVHSIGIGTGESLLDIGDVAPESAEALAAAAPRSRRLLLALSLVGATCALAVAIGAAIVCVLRRKRARMLLRGKPAHDDRRGGDPAGSGDSLLASDEYEDLVRHERCRKKAGDDCLSASAGGGDADFGGGARGEESGSQHGSSVSSWSEEPAIANMDVSTGHMVLSYMEDHLKNKERLDKEWQDLCAYEADPNATDLASLHKNRKKNRYLTVLPYDHNRVVLDEKNNVASEDYINASFIVDHDPRSPAYIATQGPLVHTVADFWQMVWEQGCVVIAMLTRLSEGSVAMCHRYWPHDSSELYHIYEVHLVSEHVWSDDYLVRSFYLKNLETNETRTVTQFHYLAWPEGGVPVASKSLLDFRRKVNKSYRGRSRPVMVVCSDGAGRTGSFILLDMVINRMNKGAKEIDIAATLEFLRDQRTGTVRTREQFEFVLTSIAEEVQAVLRGASH